ncbi:MAG: hypothetical protein FJ087_09655 [Deltaproteobacteria bacterium]|nr:hypothetical protein [Deltaproteobacteria bacterium]
MHQGGVFGPEAGGWGCGPARPPRRAATLLALAAVLTAACTPDTTGGGDWYLGPLSVTAVEPATWLPGTRVVVRGTGFVPPDLGGMTATLVGSAGGADVGLRVDLAYEAPDRAGFQVTQGVLSLLPVDGEPIAGRIVVERHGDRGISGQAEAAVEVRVVSSLTPAIAGVSPEQAWPGEEMTVTGDGFLLAGEGTTVVSLTGTWSRQGVVGADAVDGVQVPLSARERGRAAFVLSPDIALGPGTFEGTATIANRLSDAAGGGEVRGNTLPPFRIDVALPVIESVSPSVARRGQELTFRGKGFLSVDGGLGTATFIAFTGAATTASGTVPHGNADPLVLVPDRVTGNREAALVLRVFEGIGGKGVGLGAERATLDGTFTPHVLAAGRVLVGVGLTSILSIEPQLQVVYLRFLPTFRLGLEAFGLSSVAEQVEERAASVCAADYARWSVEVRLTRPDDFVEYTTVEVMGRDPNDAGLLGLDNTFGKDVGNLRFDDLLGGYNAESEEAGFYGYGGVFVESFLGFSATLAAGAGPAAADMASPEFDAVFSAFSPRLGGTPASGRDDPRAAALAEAIRVLGGLIGDTVTHEVGHSFGLAAFAGDWHNPGDTPGSIMDAGAFRPFAERAQLPGAPLRHFVDQDAAYLDEVLPRE